VIDLRNSDEGQGVKSNGRDGWKVRTVLHYTLLQEK